MWHCHLNFSVDNGRGLNQTLRHRLKRAGFINHGTGTWIRSANDMATITSSLNSFWHLVSNPHECKPGSTIDSSATMDRIWIYFYKD
jgi:hypothetical protein